VYQAGRQADRHGIISKAHVTCYQNVIILSRFMKCNRITCEMGAAGRGGKGFVVCLRPGCWTAIDLMGGGRVCKHCSQPGVHCNVLL